MEICVVIPSAPESKISVLESLKNQEEKVKQIVVARGKNTSRNRNKGVTAAKAELIAFTNAHSSFPSNWVKKVKEFFERHPEIDIVGGPQLTPEDNKSFGKVSGFALSSVFGAAGVRKRYSAKGLNLNAGETDITSANLICRRYVFDKIEWDEKIYPGEDPKFISDAKKTGFRVAYSPDILGFNKRRESPAGLFKQVFKYGFMRTKKEKVADTLGMPLFFVPSLFVAYLIFLIGFSAFGGSFTGAFIGAKNFSVLNSLLLVPLGFYLILVFLFSLVESIKNKNIVALPLLVVIFPTIHIGYGIGMIWGYIRKIV